ncbi:MAG: glycosyltransferase [Proteobacteria bacterium]|nr:glycosyltransferase [Pseudomonadota bacterium]
MVVITAKDAAGTAAYAVSSALCQGPVAEVVFVDDGSRDGTAEIAAAADDGSGRLKIIRQATNVGPARARNLAIAASTSPLICILDADDYMAPGRLNRLLAAGGGNWDLLADDLFFTPDYVGDVVLDKLLPPTTTVPGELSLDDFIAGNISRKDRHRREMGFLKPVMRRSSMERFGLRYDERLRLGEDLILYARALLNGARFRVVEGCGYYAVERPNSLSGSHRTADIVALHRALTELDDAVGQRGKDVPALRKLIRATRNNRDFRVLLDAKRERGLMGALAAFYASPASIPFIARAIAEAKLGLARQRLSAPAVGADTRSIAPAEDNLPPR